jgi:hypothetical protein
VLERSPAGFVSVTTFKRLSAGNMHSYLHYVEKPKGKGSKNHKGRGKRKGRKEEP